MDLESSCSRAAALSRAIPADSSAALNLGHLSISLVLNQTNCVSFVLSSALRGNKSLLSEAKALVNEA